MGYYTGYQNNLYPVGSLDVANLTHLMVSRIYPNGDTTLVQNFDIDNTNGPIWAKAAVSKAHAGGKKAIVMLGGDGTGGAMTTATSPANLSAFVTNLLNIVDGYGFDGIDVDWEPCPSTSHPNALALVNALRSARPNIIITWPLGWSGSKAGAADSFFGQLSGKVDRLNIMNYGMSGAWDGWRSWHSSALYGESGTTPSSVASSVNAYLAAGVPAAKLGIGAGF